MERIDSLYRFFHCSPKRQEAFEKWIMDICPSEEKRRKLKQLCKTRWVERHEALEVFIDLFLPLVSCLEEMSLSTAADWNRDTRAEAHTKHFGLHKRT